jgi:hypothetical protein
VMRSIVQLGSMTKEREDVDVDEDGDGASVPLSSDANKTTTLGMGSPSGRATSHTSARQSLHGFCLWPI